MQKKKFNFSNYILRVFRAHVRRGIRNAHASQGDVVLLSAAGTKARHLAVQPHPEDARGHHGAGSHEHQGPQDGKVGPGTYQPEGAAGSKVCQTDEFRLY